MNTNLIVEMVRRGLLQSYHANSKACRGSALPCGGSRYLCLQHDRVFCETHLPHHLYNPGDHP